MSINGVDMVTDRTQADVERAKALIKKTFANMSDDERQEFLAGLKGAYNYTDFNRVESAVDYLSDRLVNMPEELKKLAEQINVNWNKAFDVPYPPDLYKNVITKCDWSVSDVIDATSRKRYIENILLVLASFHVTDNDLPYKLDGLNYSRANAIEKCLDALGEKISETEAEKKKIINGVASNWYYSGELFCGEA